MLARPVGAAPGTKGLSLFLVPKLLPDPEAAARGQPNGVYVTGFEHEMGLMASATCELTFGQHDGPAVGYLVGDVHNGIVQMFKIMEFARMALGGKAIATLSTGYLNALEFAKTRVQGTDLSQMTNKTAPKVTILHHPDVRRSLLMQKAYAEGLRALCLYTAAHQDDVVAELVSGADADLARRVNDLLLPIVKGIGSERSYQYLSESLQTLGGSGYLKDYPIEQYVRDAKIDSLYEGTTGADVHAMIATLTGYFVEAITEPREAYRVGLQSVPFLLAVEDLLIGWLLLWHGEIALSALDGQPSERARAFYSGKVTAATFFVANVLPRLGAERCAIETTDLAAMDLEEQAF